MKRICPLVLCLALIPRLAAQEPAPAPDPAQVELARQVIKSMHADRMIDQISAQMQSMAAQALNLNSAKMTPEQKAAAAKVSSQVMALSLDSAKGMLDKLDVVYAEVYSPAELKAMKAFFDSPEGVSMLQKQPQIMQKLMPYVTSMQRDLIPKIQKITEEARAEAQGSAPAQTTQPARP
ncbi:MAG TPA: DUF2059 domain-containing protein [Opitutaceae bacterium]|nr:DUF2059 domain-containing protein [Opitutaceae bacterium]